MRAILIGHSHSAAIMAALDPSTRPATGLAACDIEHVFLKDAPFHGLLRHHDNQLTDCGRLLSERLQAVDALILCLEGNWHNAIGLVDHPQRFDFFGLGEEALPLHGRRVIPRNLMASIFLRRMEMPMKSADGILRSSFAELVAFIRERTNCPCGLVEPPPPIPSPEKIASFRRMAADSKNGVTPFGIRKKLWSLQCSLMRQYCERLRIDYLPVPDEVIDADGMLDPRAYAGIEDPTHMNSWYGQMVVRQLDAWLQMRNVRRSAPG